MNNITREKKEQNQAKTYLPYGAKENQFKLSEWTKSS